MKRYFEIFAALFLGTTMMFSCQQAEEPTMDQGTVPQTRAYGDTPVVAIYVETNDTNPLIMEGPQGVSSIIQAPSSAKYVYPT